MDDLVVVSSSDARGVVDVDCCCVKEGEGEGSRVREGRSKMAGFDQSTKSHNEMGGPLHVNE